MPMAYTNPIDLGDGRFQFSDDAGQPVILPGTPSVRAQAAKLSPTIVDAAAPQAYQPPTDIKPMAFGGQVEPGNIDLTHRPYVRNADGSVSTILSGSYDIDGKHVLLPHVSDDGRILDSKAAIDQYETTGKHLGVFKGPREATKAAIWMHEDQMRNPPINTLTDTPDTSRTSGAGDFGVAPDVAAAAQRGPDKRTANLDSAISGALAQGRTPSSPDAFGPISSGVAPPPQSAAQSMGGDQAKIAAALGAGGGTNPFDQRQTDPRILQAQASAPPPKPQQLIFAGGGAQQAQAPQQSPGRVIPGGFQPHSRSAQMQAPIPEDDLTDIKRGITGQMTANDAMGRTQAETANETAGEYQNQAAGLGQIQNDNASREAVRQQRMDDAQAKFDQMNHALQGQHIDPAKAFRDESDADKFFTSLLVGLSTYGAGISHGDNTGLKLFRSRIDDSIAAQNKDLETQRAGVENQRGLVGMMREQFGDQRQADAAARMAYLDMGKQKLAEIAARGLGTEGKMKLDAANAALQTDWAKEKAKFDQATAGVISQSDVYRPAQVVGGPQAAPFAKNDGSFVDIGGGRALKASSPEMAGQWRQQLDAVGEIHDNIAQYRAELHKGPSFANVKKMAMLRNNIATSIGAAKLGSNRMTGQGELENLQHVLETGDTVTTDMFGRLGGALDAVESSVDGASRRIFNSAPVYTKPVETKTGDLIRYRMPDTPTQREVKTQEVE